MSFHTRKTFIHLHNIKVEPLQSHDCFNDVFSTFLDLESVDYIAVYGRVIYLSDFIKNILICVLKMNEGFTGVERHEGEELMTEISFLRKLTL